MQYIKTVAELVRAQYWQNKAIIWPVKISRPSEWLVPCVIDGRRELLPTGCRTLQDYPLGTWLDILDLVRSGKAYAGTPLCKQVRQFVVHEHKKYSTAALNSLSGSSR